MDLQYDASMLRKALGGYMNKIRCNFVAHAWNDSIIHADITNIIQLFKHLQIDEDYKIVVSYQNIGVIVSGKVFAVKKGHEVYDGNYNKHYEGPLEYKVGQYPPMEVIFCDGTPEGYLEIAIFNNTIEQLESGQKNPVKNFVCYDETIRESSKPFIIKPNNWLPKYYVDCVGYKTLLTYEYDYLNSISLCSYNFCYGTYSLAYAKDCNIVYKSHVLDIDKRFSENKQCCIFKRKQIAIRDGDKALKIIY